MIGLLFFVGVMYFGAFMFYHNWDLIAYCLTVIIYEIAVILFWSTFFWIIAVGIAIIASLAILVNFGVLFAIKIKMSESEINKLYT